MTVRLKLEAGDWVRFKGLTRIYEVEEVVAPKNDWEAARPEVKVIGFRMNKKIDDVDEIRRRGEKV